MDNDWFRKLLDNTTRGVGDEREVERHLAYEGTFEDADKRLQEALTTIMDFACNAPKGATHTGVREVGEKMVMQMIGVEVAVVRKGKVIDQHVAGDFTITVERVR